jgi:hypothetical protein
MSTLVSNPFCTPCHFRADGVFCAEGLLYYSQPYEQKDSVVHRSGDIRLRLEYEDHVEIAVYNPVTVEGEPVTCSACDGKGHILTAEGKQLLVFMQTAGRSVLRDLVDELFEEREQH